MDSTNECFSDMKTVPGSESATVNDLRAMFCKRCRNTACEASSGVSDPFVNRVQTQLDVMFNTPQIKQSEVSKYSSIPDFKLLENIESWGPSLKQFQSATAKPELLIPQKGNTPTPKGGYVIGGAPEPPKTDPWGHPDFKKVKSGAKIKFDKDGKVIE